MTRTRTLVALAVVTVLCLLAGVVSLLQADSIRSTESATNLAVVDGELSSEVEGQIATALGQILSYDHGDPGPTEAAAERVLTGDAAEQYDTLFADLEERAAGQELTLSARVAVVGVRRLTESKADLLVFLDQSSVRKTDESSSVAAAQLKVSAVKREGSWLISSIEPI